MSVSTTYKVFTEFLIRDGNFTRGMQRIKAEASAAKHVLTSVSRMGRSVLTLGGLGAGVGLYFGIERMKRDLIDYNSQLDQMKIGIAGATAAQVQWNGAASKMENYIQASKWAGGLFRDLQRDAAASIGTTQDFVQAFQMLSGPIAKTGLARTDDELKEMGRDMTRLSVATSAVLMGSEGAQIGIQQIQRMLLGQSGAEMRMAQMLGIVGKEAEKFNKLSVTDRYKRLRQELLAFGPAIKDYETSWAGVSSTLQDTHERLMGVVGGPLYDWLRDSVSSLNIWIGENEDNIQRLASTMGQRLVVGVKEFLGLSGSAKTTWEDVEGAIVRASDSMGRMADNAKKVVDYAKYLIDMFPRATEYWTEGELFRDWEKIYNPHGKPGGQAPIDTMKFLLGAAYSDIAGPPGSTPRTPSVKELLYRTSFNPEDIRYVNELRGIVGGGHGGAPYYDELARSFATQTAAMRGLSTFDTRFEPVTAAVKNIGEKMSGQEALDYVRGFLHEIEQAGLGGEISESQRKFWENLAAPQIKSIKADAAKTGKVAKKTHAKMDKTNDLLSRIHRDLQVMEPDRIAVSIRRGNRAVGYEGALTSGSF